MRRRPSLTSLILMMLVIVAGGTNSARDLLAGPSDCEYCQSAATAPTWLPPVILMLPTILLDNAPEALLPLLLPVSVEPPLAGESA